MANQTIAGSLSSPFDFCMVAGKYCHRLAASAWAFPREKYSSHVEVPLLALCI